MVEERVWGRLKNLREAPQGVIIMMEVEGFPTTRQYVGKEN